MQTHYIITNREVVSKPKNLSKYWKVNDEEHIRIDGKEMAGEALRFGTYSFKNEADKGKLEIFPEGDIETLSNEDIASLPSKQFFEGIYDDMLSKKAGEGDILVFIHGYNTDLQDALDNLRMLDKLYVEDKDCPINTIAMFTWSSQRNLLGYREDARDAKTSGFAFGRSVLKYINYLHQLKKAQQPLCKQRIHFMAHSHGVKVLEWAMMELKQDSGNRLNDLFAHTILLAGDVDRDALQAPNPLYDLIDICQKVHIFYHRRDRMLSISENTKNPLNRLGRRGPKNELSWLKSDYKLYDVSQYDDDLGNLAQKAGNHWYYYTSSKVIEMIINIFKS